MIKNEEVSEVQKGDLQKILDSSDVLLQPFQSFVKSHGEISMVLIDGEFSHAVKKTPPSGEFVIHGGKEECFTPSIEEIQLAERSLQVSKGLIGETSNFLFGRVDLLTSNNGNEKLVSELEILDPELFFRYSPAAVQKISQLIQRKISKKS